MAYSVGRGGYEVRGEGRDTVSKIHGDVEWWRQLRLRFDLNHKIVSRHNSCMSKLIKIYFVVHSANDQIYFTLCFKLIELH